jgi:hypothetical protein
VTFSAEAGRWLLVLHTVLSVATVGALTHLVIWMWGYRKGEVTRHRVVRRFALIAVALFAANFIIGNVIYPTYRTRVRVEYLDSSDVVMEDARRSMESRARAAERNHAPEPAIDPERGDEAARARAEQALLAARWFDVKEHWVALGLMLTAVLALILFAWHPRDEDSSRVIAPYLWMMAIGAAGSVWIAGIIGVITAAWRAI